MKTIDIETRDGKIQTVPIYNIDDFPYPNPVAKGWKKVIKGKNQHKRSYYNVSAAFDIETTTIVDSENSTADKKTHMGFMYIWQFCLENTVCMGRTWKEFQTFVERLSKALALNDFVKLCVYVHYLPFEFQFFRDFFNVEKVFARDKRDVVVADIGEIEFRCSYALSNMSLDKFCKNSKLCTFNKQSGKDFNYRKLRLPTTELSDEELTYCYNDVRGLCQCIDTMLLEDTIATIPLTSTGYLRRDCRKAVLANEDNWKQVQNLALTPKLYILCKTAARGGNTHANAIYTNNIISDVKSKDKKSSYPATMVLDDFPMTAFRTIRPSIENFESVISEKACLIDITFHNIRMKSTQIIPYISLSKCTGYSKSTKARKSVGVDNGRVLWAEEISCVITDIDYKIIASMYSFDSIELRGLHISEYGKLNNEFRELLMEYFTEKCRLENGDPYLYAKFKNKVNAFFGMMLTDICHPEIIYVPNSKEPWKEGDIDVQKMLDKYYNSRNSFLTYQHGIWVTAHARRRLQHGLDLVGSDTVYIDTDSIKYVEDHDADFKILNDGLLAECENNDIKPYAEIDGKRTYLGLWEDDGDYVKFITLGAKKYAYTAMEKNNRGELVEKLHITVAGLNKADGAKYLEKCENGIHGFKIGTKVPPFVEIEEIDEETGEKKIVKVGSGRTSATYNDLEEIRTITVEGCEIEVGSNIGIKETSYEFGVTDEYFEHFTSVQ